MSLFVRDFFGSELRPGQSLLCFVYPCFPVFDGRLLAFATTRGTLRCASKIMNIDHRLFSLAEMVNNIKFFEAHI
jgi:hypothetical protein